jgi:hypothetical protein
MLATYFHHGRFPGEGGFPMAEKIASVKLSSARKHGNETFNHDVGKIIHSLVFSPLLLKDQKGNLKTHLQCFQ